MKTLTCIIYLLCVAICVCVFSNAQADPRWGDITAKRCMPSPVGSPGTREWSGVLWDIPFGHSWEEACKNTPASVSGDPSRPPDKCVTGTNEWGVWYRADSACMADPEIALQGFRACNGFTCTARLCSDTGGRPESVVAYTSTYFCLFCSSAPVRETKKGSELRDSPRATVCPFH